MTERDLELASEMVHWIDQILPLLPESEDDFTDDPARYGIASLLINLGECAKQTDACLRDDLPTLPWKEMTGLRDVLAHNTKTVDYTKVWRAVSDLSRIRTTLAAYLAEK